MSKKKNNWPDSKIIKLFAFISIVSLVIIYIKHTNYYSCDKIQVNIVSNKYQEGEVVAFSCDFDKASEYIWNFGDGSKKQEGRIVNHIYKSSGKYLLSLEVDGVCTKENYIEISPLKTILDSTLYPRFSIPRIAYIDEEITAIDRTKNSRKWEWRFGESFGIDANTKSAKYTYRTTGVKQVTLIVDGRYEFAGKITITVLPPIDQEIMPLVIPELEDEEPLPIDTSYAPDGPSLSKISYTYKTKELTNELLTEILMLISENKKTVKDLDPYTCGNSTLPIRVNELRSKLDVFCKKIKGKKIKIDEIKIMKNEKTNCVTFLKIKYRKRRLGGLFYY